MGEQTNGPGPAPTTLKAAGGLAALQGLVGVGIAVVLVGVGVTRHGRSVAQGLGTAAWFAVLSVAVAAAGVGLVRSQRWGRAIVVLAQLLQLPVAWYMLRSHRPELGVPVGLVAVIALILLFAPPSTRWIAQTYRVKPSQQ